MTTAIQVFNHEDFGNVRVLGDYDNPLFCLSDVCKIVDLPQVAKVVQRLDKEVLSTHPLETAGGVQEMYFVNEDGLYDVILDSRKAEAKRFRKWITSEVLPSIRKTGFYSFQKPVSMTPLNAVNQTFEISEKIQKFYAVKKGIATAQAIALVEPVYGNTLKPLKDLLPPAEHETGFLNAIQIGERLGGIPAKSVNKMLAHAGLQYKSERGWRLTDKGSDYGEEMPYTRNGHSGYQIRWNEDVMSIFEETEI